MNNKKLLPIVSGLLIGTSFIPFPPWATLFCFIPLWLYVINNQQDKHLSLKQKLKRNFMAGWVTQFILTLVGFNWIAYTVHEFGRMNWFVSIIGLIVFCSIANLYIPLICFLWTYICNKLKLTNLKSLLLLGFSTALIKPLVWTLFPWDYAYTWYSVGWPIYQIADVIGFQGISSLIILANSTLLIAFIYRKQKLGKLYAAGTLSVFFILSSLGWLQVKTLKQPDKKLSALLVQGNIGNQEKVYAETGSRYKETIYNTFLNLTSEGIKNKKPDFAIWPETAFPSKIYENNNNPRLTRRMMDYLKINNLHLITGGYGKNLQTGQARNSLFFINPKKEVQSYSKTHLLAFGETIPGSQFFPKIKKLLPMIADFEKGTGPEVIDFKSIKIGAQICYESLSSSFSGQLNKMGAQAIVNVTNDSWFGKHQEPYQHLYMTLARGVETRTPVIRSTNTGVTTVGLADGSVLKKSPLHKKWQHTYEVPYYSDPIITFYSKFPYLIRIFLLLGLIFCLFGGFIKANEKS